MSLIHFFRIPYTYVPSGMLGYMRKLIVFSLDVINDIHRGRPNIYATRKAIKKWIYYPSTLLWMYDRATDEFNNRGRLKVPRLLNHELFELKSRSITEILPPEEFEVVEDVVILLTLVEGKEWSGGIPLPSSYVDLVRKYYDGFTPQGFAGKRVVEAPGHHRNHDAGWYKF